MIENIANWCLKIGQPMVDWMEIIFRSSLFLQIMIIISFLMLVVVMGCLLIGLGGFVCSELIRAFKRRGE